MSHASGIFSRHHITYELTKTTCVLPTTCFQSLKVSVSFPPLKANFGTGTLFFEVCHFLICQFHKWHTTHLYLTRHNSKVIHATALFQAGSGSAHPTLPTTSGKGFVLASVESSQSVQKLLDHITYTLSHINSDLNFTKLPRTERYIKLVTFAYLPLYKTPK
jgi:hypothetical protein